MFTALHLRGVGFRFAENPRMVQFLAPEVVPALVAMIWSSETR